MLLCFQEPFPAASDLTDSIQAVWPFVDVCFDGLTSVCYGLLRQQWRENHREQFLTDTVSVARQALQSGDATPPRRIISGLIQSSHEIWRADSADLIGLAYDMLKST